MNSDILGFLLHDPDYLNAHWMSLKVTGKLVPVEFELYRTYNAVFGKVDRTASEEVTLQLVLSKCVSVLLYGLSIKYFRHTIVRLRYKSIFL